MTAQRQTQSRSGDCISSLASPCAQRAAACYGDQGLLHAGMARDRGHVAHVVERTARRIAPYFLANNESHDPVRVDGVTLCVGRTRYASHGRVAPRSLQGPPRLLGGLRVRKGPFLAGARGLPSAVSDQCPRIAFRFLHRFSLAALRRTLLPTLFLRFIFTEKVLWILFAKSL